MLALKGDERLSGNSRSSSGREPSRSGSPEKRNRRDRAGTVGRALRTVYDETLREEIPRDFLDLLRKLD